MKFKKTGKALLAVLFMLTVLLVLTACSDGQDERYVATKYVCTEKGSRVTEEYRYDKNSCERYVNGNLSARMQFNDDGVWTDVALYGYDESDSGSYLGGTYDFKHVPAAMINKDLILNGTVHYFNGNTRVYSTAEYNDDGYVTKITIYNTNGNITFSADIEWQPDGGVRYHGVDHGAAYAYEYDAKGHLVKEILHDEDGALLLNSEYEYDAAGNRIKEQHYGAGDVKLDYIIYEYNEKDQMIKASGYKPNGGFLSYDEYEYDEHGNRTYNLRYDAEGFLIATDGYEYFYDGRGNMARKIFRHADGTYDICFEALYDPAGRLAQEKQYSREGDAIYNYEYDKNGNLVKRTTYNLDGDLVATEEWTWSKATKAQVNFVAYSKNVLK